MNEKIGALRSFLDGAHSFFHSVAEMTRQLDQAGYTRLIESEDWALIPGGKYYINRGGSSVLAFRVPRCTPVGYMMSATHCDYPTFRVKVNGQLCGAYIRMATERYGGMILAPWLDRPLSVAGQAMVETENGIETRLVDIDRDLALIPSVAIHMNPKINENTSLNVAVDMIPLLGGPACKDLLDRELEQAAGGKLLGADLYLYVRQRSSVWGLKNEFISAPGLDDLLCVWGCLEGFLQAGDSGSIPVMAVFDSEETGSNSRQGADSTMLATVLTRISRSLGVDHDRMLANSMLVSADMAHALHPNHPEYADPANAPVMNGGVVMKFNAAKNYVTTGLSAALFRKVCAKAQVPLQTFHNRADIKGGSTLGYISMNHVSVPSVDVGLAQLAMHSSYETAGVEDAFYLEKAMATFFGSTLRTDGETYILD
jgi:aspartyl aminopeptidase